MADCSPIRFGINNSIPLATLTATPAPVTPLDNIKNEHRERIARWTDPSVDIVIRGEFAESQVAEYFSLPTSNLVGLAEVKLDLFEDLTSTVDVLGMESQPIAEPPAVGVFRVGIDALGVPLKVDRPSAFMYDIGRSVIYKAFELTISHSELAAEYADDVRLRMLTIGHSVQMQHNFSYGHKIRHRTDPELIETRSGSTLSVRPQKNKKRLLIDLNMMSNDDADALRRMELTLDDQPFIVSAHPSETGWKYNSFNFLARFGNANEIASVAQHINSSSSILFLEA